MADEETVADRALNETPAWSGPERASSQAQLFEEDAKGADQLRGDERELYEKTRVKVMVSLVYGALALVFLGFCAETGGRSTAFKQALNRANAKNLASQTLVILPKIKEYWFLDAASLTLLYGGVGFGAFCHFCAFVLAVAAAVLMSPFMTGTVKEMGILRGPVDFSKELARRRSSKATTFSGISLN